MGRTNQTVSLTEFELFQRAFIALNEKVVSQETRIEALTDEIVDLKALVAAYQDVPGDDDTTQCFNDVANPDDFGGEPDAADLGVAVAATIIQKYVRGWDIRKHWGWSLGDWMRDHGVADQDVAEIMISMKETKKKKTNTKKKHKVVEGPDQAPGIYEKAYNLDKSPWNKHDIQGKPMTTFAEAVIYAYSHEEIKGFSFNENTHHINFHKKIMVPNVICEANHGVDVKTGAPVHPRAWKNAKLYVK